MNLPNIQIDQDGNFSLDNITPGTYQMVIYVTAPNGEKLAGQKATLTVNNSGQASVQSQLIDPFGTFTYTLTHQALDGVKAIFWLHRLIAFYKTVHKYGHSSKIGVFFCTKG